MIVSKACTPQSNDERMATWAWKYLSAGYHRRESETLSPSEWHAKEAGMMDAAMQREEVIE